MNVENRKLFANRDARKRLAEMGGILASSPELMGEAMKFANGGTARERAISGQGALDQFASSGMQPLDFSFRDLDRDLGSEMQALDDRVQGRIVSFLGNLFEVVGDKIFHTESGVEIEEPNLKAEILTQGDRIAGEDLAMAVPFPQGQARNYTQLVSDIENPIERGRALLAASSPEVELENAPITSMNRIAGEDMAMAQDVEPEVMFPGELSRAFVPEPRGAEELMAGSIYPAEERFSDKNARQRAISELGLTPITRNGKEYFISPAGMVFKRKGEDLVPVDTAEAMQAMDVAQQQGKDFTKSPIGMIPIGTRDVDPSTGLVDPDAPLKRPDADISGTRTPQFLTKALGPDSAVSDLLSVQEGAASNVDETSEIAKAVEKNNPAAVTEALKKRFMDRDSDIVPSTVDQLTKEPPKGAPDDDTPDDDKPAPKLSRAERVTARASEYAEALGFNRDKSEDMYDLMATIGFAMASGESPNAMKNIADAFLIGAQMKRADKDKDEERKEKLNLLALQGELDLESQEAALRQTLAEETRAEQRNQRKMRFQFGLDAALERLKLSGATQKGLRNAILDMAKEVTGYTGKPPTPEELETIGTAVLTLPGFEGMSLNDINPADIGVDKKSAVEQKYKITP